ncbi:MAG: hypothetical protein LLG04_07860 [Parachlamydia sp.]|nr:hypothetical protein [Parachlamydia sp.]
MLPNLEMILTLVQFGERHARRKAINLFLFRREFKSIIYLRIRLKMNSMRFFPMLSVPPESQTHHLPQKFAFGKLPRKRLNGVEYYHVPSRFESYEVVVKCSAPYLHAYQDASTDNRCGYYAALCFFGQPIPFSKFARALIHYLIKEKGIQSFEEAKAIVHTIEFGRINEETLHDVDVESLKGAIEFLANDQTISPYFSSPSLFTYDLQKQSWTDIKDTLLPLLKKNDRAIVGIASPFENHLFCLRKDLMNVWWRVDSLLDTQEGIKEDQIVSEIQALYGSYTQGLLFIILPKI